MIKRLFLLKLLAVFYVLLNISNSFAGEPGTVKWKVPLDRASCFSPALGHNDTIYVPSGNRLLAINPDKSIKWTFDAGGWVNTPSVDSVGNIYFGSEQYGTCALDSYHNLLWNFKPAVNTPGADCENIAIGSDHTIYDSVGGGILHAIDSLTGELKWTSSTATTTPAINESGTLYATGPSSLPLYLFAVDKNNGSITMQSEIPVPDFHMSPVLGNNGDVYVIGNARLYAFNPDGTKAWEESFPPGNGYYFSRVVTGSDGTIFYAYSTEAVNGTNIVAKKPDGTGWGFNGIPSYIWGVSDILVGNDETIYVASSTGMLALDSQGIAKFNLQYDDGFSNISFSSSSVMGSDGTLYAIGQEQDSEGRLKAYLYAINTSSSGPANSSWPMMGANAQHTHEAKNASVKLPDTGQTSCYDAIGNVINCAGTGQDGAYNINPLSYTDNGDGTVTDNNTGLMWQKQDDGGTYNWYWASGTYDTIQNLNGENVCGSLPLAGHYDWRLPTEIELMSIVDYEIAWPGPTIQPVFTNTPAGEYSNYWSSTVRYDDTNLAFHLHFGGIGAVTRSNKYYALRVRCVRGGQAPGPILSDNGDRTVTDIRTGLIWQQDVPGSMSWGEALSYCESLPLGNRTDWRLPNIKELEFLVDDTTYNPAFYNKYFPDFYSFSSWSSTTNATYPSCAFSAQGFGWPYKSQNVHVRCVRSAEVKPPPPPTCTYTYSDWGACQPDGTQKREKVSETPEGCVGTPELSRSCCNIEVSPSSYNFGEVIVSTESTQPFTIKNTGKGDLIVTDITLSDTDNFKLSIISAQPCKKTYKPEDSCTFDVYFNPKVIDNFNANLTITSNDSDTPQIAVIITGSSRGLLTTSWSHYKPNYTYPEEDYYDLGCGAVAVGQLINYYFQRDYRDGWLEIMLQNVTVDPRFCLDPKKECKNVRPTTTTIDGYETKTSYVDYLSERNSPGADDLREFLWYVALGLDSWFHESGASSGEESWWSIAWLLKHDQLKSLLIKRFRFKNIITVNDANEKITLAQKKEYIRKAIDENQPVLISMKLKDIDDKVGKIEGHLAIIDGYRELPNGTFEVKINWGWGNTNNENNSFYPTDQGFYILHKPKGHQLLIYGNGFQVYEDTVPINY